jgi:transcriptional regulator with XRE-family HTH domain
MVTPDRRPSVVRRQLGRRLRRLRETSGRTVEDVTVTGVASRTKMWRIEAGRAPVRVGDVLALARLYEAENAVVDELVRLAEASRGSGYAEDFKADVRESVRLYADLEAGAAEMADYSCEVVHGLLQAEEYIRAIMAADPALTLEVARQRMSFQLRRQRGFFDRSRPGRVDAILTEGALRVQVGSNSVMEAQREHLRALARKDGVSIRVLPFDNALHPRPTGPFTILDFDDPDDPSVACVENVIETRYFDRSDHVARFRAEFEQVRAQAVPVEDYLR